MTLLWFVPNAAARLKRRRADILRFAASGPFLFEIRDRDRMFRLAISRPKAPATPVIERDFVDETDAILFADRFASACAEIGPIAALDRVSSLMAPADSAPRSRPAGAG